jgi:hypothetical protein
MVKSVEPNLTNNERSSIVDLVGSSTGASHSAGGPFGDGGPSYTVRPSYGSNGGDHSDIPTP